MLAALEREGFRFAEVIKVRWSEVDPQRVVFNGHYLTYIDEACGEYISHMFGDSFPEGFDIMLVKAELEYRKSARGGERLHVGIQCLRLGRSSLTFRFEIRREHDEALLLHATQTYVNVDLTTGKSRPIGETFRQAIREFDHPAEA